jgi:hypothetical protein
MNLHVLLATNNKCYIKNHNTKWTPKGVMVHSTGCNNPNLKRYVGPDDGLLGENANKNYWNTYRPGGQQICCHAFIGKLKDGSIATYQILPWTCKGWNNGNATGNSTYLAFEICEDGLTDKTYFDKVYKEAVELTAYLCKMFSIDVDKYVIDHSEGYKRGVASNHGDVAHWFPKFGKSMDTFRADVKAEMNKAAVTPTVTPTVTPAETTESKGAKYIVQAGAFNKKEYADAMVQKLKAAGFSAVIRLNGDVDGDDKVTAADARSVLRKSVGLEE